MRNLRILKIKDEYCSEIVGKFQPDVVFGPEAVRQRVGPVIFIPYRHLFIFHSLLKRFRGRQGWRVEVKTT